MAKQIKKATTKKATKKAAAKPETKKAKAARLAKDEADEKTPIVLAGSAVDAGALDGTSFARMRPIRVSVRTYESTISDDLRSMMEAEDMVRHEKTGSRHRVRLLRSGVAFLLSQEG